MEHCLTFTGINLLLIFQSCHSTKPATHDLFVKLLTQRKAKSCSFIIGPALRLLKQGAQVIDLPGMVEIMGDHDVDLGAGRQAVAPIGEALAIQFGIICQRWCPFGAAHMLKNIGNRATASLVLPSNLLPVGHVD